MPNNTQKPISVLHRLFNKLFSTQLEFRVRLFNLLAVGGILAGTIMGAFNAINGGGLLSILIDFIGSSSLSLALLIYSYKTGRYQRCYFITIVVIFLIYFPSLFFRLGGYQSGQQAFFIFAIVFTAFMLEGRAAWIVIAIQVIVFSCICIFGYLYPGSVAPLDSDFAYLLSTIGNFVSVSLILSLMLIQHLGLYNQQQKKLDEQNAVLAQANSMKIEFLANASHEMRTPLTVTSVNVQTVMEILEDMGDKINDPEAAKLLQSAQSEIMRLSRMVGGMLTLASMSEKTDRQKLDLSQLLQSAIEMLRLNISKHGNTIQTEIESDLCVFGNADLLMQVLSNILQNAGTHTENGTLTVSAKKKGNEITVTVRDTGTGISPKLLPHIFERGVSTGGTGYGLYLCKTVVESHSGRIWIESEPEIGTTVFYTLPFYEGQFGGSEI